MLQIDSKIPQERWLDAEDYKAFAAPLAGVRIKVRPNTVAMSMAAADARQLAYKQAGCNPPKTEEEEAATPDKARYAAFEAASVAMARFAIIAWEGIGYAADKPVPVPVTDDTIRAVMRLPIFYAFFEQAYVLGLQADASEKNVSAPSQTGTSGAKTRAKATAATAQRRARTARTS